MPDSRMNGRAEMRNRFNALKRVRLDHDKDRWVINGVYYDMKGKSPMQLGLGIETNIPRAENNSSFSWYWRNRY